MLIWGGGLSFFLQKEFIYVMLRLYTEFQCSTMPGTGQNVCCGVVGVGGVGWVGVVGVVGV